MHATAWPGLLEGLFERNFVEAAAGGPNDEAVGVRRVELGGSESIEWQTFGDHSPGGTAVIGEVYTGSRADVVELWLGRDDGEVVRVFRIDGNAVGEEVFE